MQCLFVQIRCRPGTTYEVAEEIARRETHSELYSTSGDFDLIAKYYVEKEDDVGLFVNKHVANISGIERTLTTLTYKAF
jgi:DNA-binding Lrp family transcriptional regulator